MTRLEQYLDQVCRSIGGPRSLRQHVRQELREHLLDAVAQHQAAGLAEAEAIDKALEEFGKPEEVRLELEATHGQRLLAVVIGKALEWKEMTMRAKWLWATWAYLALAAVIALEVLFITFMTVMIVPKYQKLMSDGMIDYGIIEEHEVTWMPAWLGNLQHVTQDYTLLLVIGAAALWGLFEWRVRSENKPLMRLAALGTVAVGLLLVVIFAAGALLISFCLAMPAMGEMSRPFAVEQIAALETSTAALDEALAAEDWSAADKHAGDASSALYRLAHGPALKSFTTPGERPSVAELRSHVSAAHDHLRAAQTAIAANDGQLAAAALSKLRESLEPVRAASQRPRQDRRQGGIGERR
jgi:hypothetical protein